MSEIKWLYPKREYGKRPWLPMASHRYPAAFLRALRRFVRLESQRQGRKVSQPVILMTLALVACGELERLYQEELQQESKRGSHQAEQ